MESLPPSSAFRLSDDDLRDIRELRGVVIDKEAFRAQRKEWKTPLSLLKETKVGHRMYPHLSDIIWLCDRKASTYKDFYSGIPDSDTLKYKLLGDLYKEGLYDPSPRSHRLHGLLDFLHFPDQVKAEAGESHFSDLLRLWELMALTVDDTLYRHSSTAYALYAPLWKEVSARFLIGYKIIKVATYYGDFDLARKIADFLDKQTTSLWNQAKSEEDKADVEYYRSNTLRLRLNFQAHTQDIGECAEVIARYRSLYEGVCAKSERIGSQFQTDPESERFGIEKVRHVELIRSICRGACRFTVRYVMRLISSNDSIDHHSLEDAIYLAREYITPSLGSNWIDHSKLPYGNHDYDTLSRVYSVVVPEYYKSISAPDKAREYLLKAKDAQDKASKANVRRRERDYADLDRIVRDPRLLRWTKGVNEAKVREYVGIMYDFWEQLSYAMLKVQDGRYGSPSDSGRRKESFLDARNTLQRLASVRHSPKLRHSGYLLASIYHIVDTELRMIDPLGRGADG